MAVIRAILLRFEAYTRRAVSFVRRHEWSLPLFISSSISLSYLGCEMREGDLVGADTAIGNVVHGWRGSMDGFMLGLTMLGGGEGMALLSVLALLALVWFRRRREALFLLLGSLGTLLISTGLKLLFHRPRPELGYLIPEPSSFSFPSGHALGSAGVPASCIVVLYAIGAPRALRVLGVTLSALFAFGVALSRVYFGLHFPSDVLGGQLAAAAWVSALTGWFYPHLFPGEGTLRAAPEE